MAACVQRACVLWLVGYFCVFPFTDVSISLLEEKGQEKKVKW